MVKSNKKTPVSTKLKTKKQLPVKAEAKQSPPSSAFSKKTDKNKEGAPVDAAPDKSISFPIVGIGASAGGLEAFEAFFSQMPTDSGAAFILVAHLDPHHVSILPDIIQKKTGMKVSQVTDNTTVKPNHVYVIPPNRELAVFNGTLQLLEMSKPRGSNLPIDSFLRSLANDQGANAVCIILSGTGTDGTLGLRAIKGEGGMAMVQEIASAKYDGMPRSAAGTELADYVLPAEKMAAQLLSYLRHATDKPVNSITMESDVTLSALNKIFLLLRARTDHDFSLYKKNTICRRIERRMHVHQIDDIADYVRYLRESEREVNVLFKELLIGVTNFFRDAAAFEVLRDKLLPESFKDKPDDYPFRVWVPGCSSGEEAYSIAIILQECMDAENRHFNVQIFGTDIDEDAVNAARAGLFPGSISADVDSARLKKHFIREGDRYLVRKSIREMVVFAPQNIIKDPPFTKLDLLSCRNLLIYFGPELQKKLLPVFHYSLKPGGILFLGSSESIGASTEMFAPAEKKWKLFKRRSSENASHPALEFPAPLPHVDLPDKDTFHAIKKGMDVDKQQLLKMMLQQSDLPPSVIIDDRADILYVHGRTGRYLEPAEGETSINILEMARPGLKAPLTGAIRKTAADRLETIIKDIQVRENGGYININIVVKPVPDFQSGVRGLMMVIFDENVSGIGKAAREQKKEPKTGVRKSEQVRKIEEELQYTRETLQTTIEELETSNEELKSTNEELQSTNEELQSTNEELETSKEELQSLNEESATVNAELQSRIDELSKANDDMKNLLAATQIATIFLDMDMCIHRFTPKATEIVPLASGDTGRPIEHFASNLIGVEIKHVAASVLDDLVTRDLEVASTAGREYRMRVMPYRTVNNLIDGVVITFDDITEFKKGEADTSMLAALMRDSYDAIILQDLSGRILSWNRGATRLYGYSKEEAMRMDAWTIVPKEERDAAKTLIEKALEQEPQPFVARHITKAGQELDVFLSVTKVVDKSNQVIAIATNGRELGEIAAFKK